MLRKLMSTKKEYSLALARIALGVVFFAHGVQKMLGKAFREEGLSSFCAKYPFLGGILDYYWGTKRRFSVI